MADPAITAEVLAARLAPLRPAQRKAELNRATAAWRALAAGGGPQAERAKATLAVLESAGGAHG